MAEEKQPAEKLEILNMIKEGKITPDEGVRLLEAIEKAENPEEGASATGKTPHAPRWLNVEICAKRGERFKSITPIRIPYSLIRLFFRFIPGDAQLTGKITIEKSLSDLEKGRPLELYSEKDGRAIRITAE